MSRAKVPTRLVLVVVACVVVGVIGFQAVAERNKVNRLLQEKDGIQERLRVRLTGAVEKHTGLKTENTKLDSEKDELQKQLIELSKSRQEEKDKFEQDVKDLQRQLHDKELEVRKLEGGVRDLEQGKSRAARKREQKEKAFVSLQDENSALSKEIAGLRAEIKMLNEDGVKDLRETNIKSAVVSTDKLATGHEVNGSELDDGTAQEIGMLFTDKHMDPSNYKHVSKSDNLVVHDPKGTEEEEEETEEDKSDVIDADEEIDKEDLQVEANEDDSDNNDFKGEAEVKTVEDKDEAEDDTDEKDGNLKTVESRIFQKGDDEEDTAEVDDQEETLDNTE
eukprot:TRINITY_DN21141_c0_g1_i1.p1 TRINITY_DN21141_c0_g1~~TRINITY_DN21141_c0_g1_i1.p1  ORF type:complete len:335 (+),score=106.87 TRINITY_DN21141_c0_g1_i1:499-1503(+)